MIPKSYDRQPNFSDGMDSFHYAADLKRNQSQLIQNFIVLDNGRAVTRPGADLLATTVFNPSGPVQGIGFYDSMTNQGVPFQELIMAQGGQFYTWNGSVWSVAIASWPQTLLASQQVVMVQGVDSTYGTVILASDGVNPMAFWNGTTFISCGATNSATNAPAGVNCLSQIAGMFVASGNAMIQNSVVYPPDTLFFSNYLAVKSGQWSVSQSFRVGNGDGEPIVGLAAIQSTASTVPVYQLAVLKQNSVWVVTINPQNYSTSGTPSGIAAMFAQLSANPQGDQVGTGIGCVGKAAYCLYQNDLLFMSQDGVQSLQRMQAAAGQYQLTAPLSEPIQNYIDRINWSYGSIIQAVKYRRWAIFFVPLDNSTVNNYALVWDGRLGQWMIWSGWTPTCAVAARFAKGTSFNGGFSQAGQQLIIGNSDGTVTVWKDSTSLQYLVGTYLDNGVAIFQRIDTRSFIFGNYDLQKKMRSAQVRFNQGTANVNLYYYFDTAMSDSASADLGVGQTTLPVILPFTLASSKPQVAYQSLLELPYCFEMYVSIQANSGFMDVREILVCGYIKFAPDPSA